MSLAFKDDVTVKQVFMVKRQLNHATTSTPTPITITTATTPTSVSTLILLSECHQTSSQASIFVQFHSWIVSVY